MIKKIIKHIVLLGLIMMISGAVFPQLNVVVGTQDFDSGDDPSPYTNYRKSRRIQFVYTASEINTALTTAGLSTGTARDIQALAWDVIGNHSMMDLTNYEIYMGHTTATDASSHSNDATSQVKASHTFSPDGTGWQQIDFDTDFAWDGSSNIIVDICWHTSYSSNNASVWMYNNVADQIREQYSSFSSQCGALTQYTFNGKPRVRLTFECDPITVSVGSDIDICNTSTVAALNGNNPASGHTGEWSVVSGSGSFTNASNYDTEVTSVGQGENVYRWTVTNSSTGCSDYADLTVNNNTPTTPDAGSDASSCNGNYQLEANIPIYGTGVWSVSSGAGVFDDNTLYNTNVSNLNGSDAGTSNTFTWTITNNGCSQSDDVDITYYYPPVASVASSPLSGCYATDALTLNGNNPGSLTPSATGEWTVVSGSGTFNDETAYNTTVTNVGTPSNTYRWTLTRNGCTSSANLVVDNLSPDAASAGADQSISAANTSLEGNTPTQGTGTWTVIPNDQGVIITDASDAETTVTNIPENIEFTFTWTISNGTCDDTFDAMTLVRTANMLGFVIQEDLTNDGVFDQTNEANFFVMNGSDPNYILGGLSSDNTYTDAKLRVMGDVIFDGAIDNGKFDITQVVASKTFRVEDNRTYKNHDFENFGTTYLDNGSTWENSGDWTNSLLVSAHENSTVEFNGDALQSITTNWDGTDNAFGNVIVNQDVVTPQASNGLDMQDDMVLQANSDLTLTNGLIVLDDDDAMVIVNNDASDAVQGDYTSSWIYAVNDARCLRRFMDEVNNEEYAFPVGTDDNPNLALLNNRNLPDGSLSIDAWFEMSPSAINTNFPTDLEESDFRYDYVDETGIWGLKPNGSYDGVYDLKLYVNDFALTSANDNEFCLIKRPLAAADGSSWSIPQTNSVFVPKLVSDGFAHRTDITNFSEFGIGTGYSTLPVELIGFNGSCYDGNTRLRWATASEFNSDYFTIERSDDGINYFPIAQIQAAGNSQTISEYEYVDYQAVGNDAYYRLTQTDFDGTTEEFHAVSVNCSETDLLVNCYPNPFSDWIYIESNRELQAEIRIVDAPGRVLYHNKHHISGFEAINLGDFTPGVYSLIINENDQSPFVFKLVKH
jgi:hypothetical protein